MPQFAGVGARKGGEGAHGGGQRAGATAAGRARQAVRAAGGVGALRRAGRAAALRQNRALGRAGRAAQQGAPLESLLRYNAPGPGHLVHA